MTGRLGVWIESQRIKGVLYRNDTLNQMKGVGQKTVEKLKLIGIKTVNDLQKMTNLNDIISPDGLSVNKVTQLIEQASKALDQDCPPTIDHRKHENPYKSRYGSDWKTQLKKSVTFCHSISICDYIKHIMEQSRNIMKDTIHEDTWMVYHDALSLMTSKSTKEWMRKKGISKEMGSSIKGPILQLTCRD